MKATLIEKPDFFVDENDISDDGSSSLFGNAFLPESWLESGDFSPYEFYVGRIAVDNFDCEIARKCKTLCEKNAFLYFFAEAKNFKFSSLKARVRLFLGEADAYTEFNEGFFEEDEVSFKLSASADEGEALVFEKIGGEVVLLSVPQDALPFEINGENLQFYIDEKDFINGEFEKCKIRVV